MTLYVIGNSDQTKYLGWDFDSSKSIVLDNPSSHLISLFNEEGANSLLKTSKYTNFYLQNGLQYKYPVRIV
jgi:hypothetical protein